MKALHQIDHDVSVGFDKIWGPDVLYPQGGLYVASADNNIIKHRTGFGRRPLVRALKWLNLTHWVISSPRTSAISRGIETIDYCHQRDGPTTLSTLLRHSTLKTCASFALQTDPGRFSQQDRPKRRIEARQQWGIGAEETIGLFAGMNYRLKGLEPLMYALQLVPAEMQYRILVVGSDRTKKYQSLAAKLGIADRIIFAGYCSEMRNAYFASDFLVHPTFYDPCSHVVPEAMACGLPVITTKYNGASELMTPPQRRLLSSMILMIINNLRLALLNYSIVVIALNVVKQEEKLPRHGLLKTIIAVS